MMETEQINIAMCVFKRHHRPTENIEETDETFTTQEILDKFHDLMGEDCLNHEEMYDLLTTHGYIYDYVIDGFKWLTKTGENNP